MKHFTYVLARGPVILSSIESTRATLFETNTWSILPWNYWEEEKWWKEGRRKKERRRTDRLSASDTRFNNSRLLVDSKCRISENSPPLSLLFSGSLRSRSVKPHVKIWSRLFHDGWRFLLPYDAFDDRRSHLPCMHIDFFVFFPISHVISRFLLAPVLLFRLWSFLNITLDKMRLRYLLCSISNIYLHTYSFI